MNLLICWKTKLLQTKAIQSNNYSNILDTTIPIHSEVQQQSLPRSPRIRPQPGLLSQPNTHLVDETTTTKKRNQTRLMILNGSKYEVIPSVRIYNKLCMTTDDQEPFSSSNSQKIQNWSRCVAGSNRISGFDILITVL